MAHAGPGLAQFYARCLDRLVPRWRRVALRNLEIAYPQMAAADRRQIADGVFRNIGRIIYAFARFSKINAANVADWIEYEGLENYLNAKQQGRGILVATAHLGNWELSAFTHAIMTEPMQFVVRPLDNPRIDRFVSARRRLSGNTLIGKFDAARSILRALRANQAVGILIDQNAAPEEGTFVDFFGTPACATTSFARLASKTGAIVIPGCALWCEQRGKYILRFYPPLSMTGDIQRDTQQVQSALEEVIRQYPDQWFWIHRRWKTRPAGQPPLY